MFVVDFYLVSVMSFNAFIFASAYLRNCVILSVDKSVFSLLQLIMFSPPLSRPDTPGGKETGAAKVSKNLI